MDIQFFTQDVKLPVFDELLIKDWIDKVITSHDFSTWNISFIFCSDEYLLSINKQYLNHDYFTDVITFDYSENRRISGDIFISLDMVAHNASEFNRGYINELFRVMIHGVLHLCGFNDKTHGLKEQMTLQENIALEMLTLDNT